ncbi:hypothetical protein BDN70DRAFT_836903 [Pholiota conissans]|uniref:Peptidase C14 caspase domain-containing protein n=1 Tax=Pholiota conissans TaxID=109636 RepID=A0A9P6CZS8_9AGAR|nr:hypothetical protein BDN70DRAFT_836903 [Pholiota conissans]
MARNNRQITRLFALLIGVNNYLCQGPELPPLRGAVPDVEEFRLYLTTYLSVPADHINILIDANATRTAILKALHDLSEDNRIEKGDAILVYYAGHGTELNAPENWEAGGPNAKIQAIVPYDCTFFGEIFEHKVPPIPDRVLEMILAVIAEKKGDNITVILDCCHSASGTRAMVSHPYNRPSDVRVRAATPARPLPPYRLEEVPASHAKLDSWATPKLSLSSFAHHGLNSHVLIAACGMGEKAHEDGTHGRFSAALLKLLKSPSFDDLRYSDIFKHLGPIHDQTPYCEGLHTDRALFNLKVLPPPISTFDVSSAPKNYGKGYYTVTCGTIYNVSPSSEFSVYRKSDIHFADRIGLLHVVRIDSCNLVATVAPNTPIFDTAAPTVAVWTNSDKKHHPHFHIPSGDEFHKFLDDLSPSHTLKQFFHHTVPLVDNSEDSHAEITMNPDGNKVNLKFTVDTTHGVFSHKLNSIITVLDPEPEDLAKALSRVAHFYHEVKFFNNNPHLSHCIVVEFYKLRTVLEPMECGWQRKMEAGGSNLCVNGAICLVAQKDDSDDDLYGMKIINNWTQDLDVNIYRFDNNDFSIKPCAESGACQGYRPGHDLPLKCGGGSMAIGYGSAGYPPMAFKLDEGLETQVLFLKIYLSAQTVNLSHLSQDSAFASTRGVTQYHPKPKVTWTDIVVPVILRRHQSRSPFMARN